MAASVELDASNVAEIKEDNFTLTNNSRSSSDSESDEEITDIKLQKAFQKGDLKPGLNFVTEKRAENINNVEGIHEKLEDFQQDLPWIERLDVTCAAAKDAGKANEEEEEDEAQDDFKREMKFYKQAQAAVLVALPKLNSLGISTKRPEDYFAEMAKSDDHMRKVREKLISKQLSMERSEKAKKLRELRKFGKKVQHEVLIQRQKEKSEMTKNLKKLSKGKMQEKKAELKAQQERKKDQSQQSKANDKRAPNRKRKYKNEKFGYGGKKKNTKMNSKDSHNADEDGFRSRKNFSDVRKGKKPQAGRQSGKRLGKNRRRNLKSRRK